MPQVPPFPRELAIAQRTGVQTTRFADWMLLLWTALNRLVAGLFDVAITTPGVTFPDPPVPSADPRTLDDYEEGLWTPVILGTGGQSGQTYTLQNGFFVKVGRKVHASCRVQLSALGTITGIVQVGGFPFVSLNATGYRAAAPVVWANLNTAVLHVAAAMNENATVATILANTAAATSFNAAFLAQANLTNTTLFTFSLEYEADA